MMTRFSQQLSITSWNVNGLSKRLNGSRHCKLDDQMFNECIVSDIVFMCETHLGYNENVSFEGYKYVANCRSSESSRLRGGLGIFVKQAIVKGVKVVDKLSTEYMWLKLSRFFFGFEKDVYICFIYIPPANSSYTLRTGIDRDIFEKLEENVRKYSSKGEIIIMGDINAHIGRNDYDYITMDSNDPLIDNLPDSYIVDSVLKDRNFIKEQSTNSHGKEIVDICVSAKLRILNGRTLGDTMGRETCYNFNGSAIDDYCICSTPLLSSILTFEVGEYNPLLSDHCQITLTLQSFITEEQDINLQESHAPKWSREIEEKFLNNLAKTDLTSVKRLLSQISSHNEDAENINSLNDAITILTETLTLSATKTAKYNKKKNRKKKNKPWFDNNCRDKLRYIRRLCRKLRNQPYNNNLRHTIFIERKKLKKIIRKNHRNFKNKIYSQLLNSDEKDPSMFWSIIDSLKENNKDNNYINITPSEWAKHFEQLMNKIQTDNFLNENKDSHNTLSYNTDVLNATITKKEIYDALKCVKKPRFV